MTTDSPASDEHGPIGGAQPVLRTDPRRLPRLPTPHAAKFRLALAALAGIAAGALAIAVVILGHGTARATLAVSGSWSSWAPSSSGSAGVAQIADHLAPYYRESAAQQLDVITPISVSQPTAAGTTSGNGLTVAVNTGAPGKGQSLGLLNGKTVAYNVCGLGPRNCELAGTPSVARMLLLRREALELALYTFRYIANSQNVVVVLPPARTVSSGGSAAPATPVTVAVAFVRRALEPWLQVPLSRTLQQYPPAVAELNIWKQTPEAGLVDQITAHALFSSQIESLQVGGRVLVLSQLPSQ